MNQLDLFTKDTREKAGKILIFLESVRGILSCYNEENEEKKEMLTLAKREILEAIKILITL